MKKYYLVFIYIILNSNIYCQDKIDWSCKECRKYHHYKSKQFKPINKKNILNYKQDFLNISELVSYTKFDTIDSNPNIDTMYLLQDHINFQDSFASKDFVYFNRIVDKMIIKYDKKDSIQAVVFGYNEIWIAYSTNYGKNWSYFYSGIVQREPIYLKWYSNIPLINKEGNIQIEGALLRLVQPEIHPDNNERYEVVKDGLCITIDINKIKKDSDKDSLTDILENWFYTNPYNPDTDNDGIKDNIDLNPRINLKPTEKTSVYESMINYTYKLSIDSIAIPIKNINKEINFAKQITDAIFIITDIKDLQAINPLNQRIIFISPKEYKKYKEIYDKKYYKLYVSPFLKLDKYDNIFKLEISEHLYGEHYWIYKESEKWIIIKWLIVES